MKETEMTLPIESVAALWRVSCKTLRDHYPNSCCGERFAYNTYEREEKKKRDGYFCERKHLALYLQEIGYEERASYYKIERIYDTRVCGKKMIHVEDAKEAVEHLAGFFYPAKEVPNAVTEFVKREKDGYYEAT